MKTSLGSRVLLVGAVLGLAAPARAGDPSATSPVDAGATALVKGNSSDAVVSFTQALGDPGLSNDRRAAILNDRAVAYMRSGQPKLAIDDFNQAAQLFPEYAAVYNNRGNLLLSLGLTKEAIKDFDRALVLAPGYGSAYNNRAGAHMKIGQVRQAIDDYTKAVQLMPSVPAPLSGRGRAYLQLAKPYAAERDFTRAVNADARFAPGYRNRAEARLEVEQFDAAIEDLSRAVAFDVGNPEIYLVRGQAYLATKNAASAIKDFQKALELDPKLVAAYQLLGLAQASVEAYEEAFADLNLAIEIDPRSAVSFAYRAIVYKRQGQVDVGLNDVQTALKLDESRPEAWWAKGEIDEATGQMDMALVAYKKALELKPGYREATEALQRIGALPPPVVVPPPDPYASRWASRNPPAIAEPEVPALAIDKWRVVMRSGRPVALSVEYPRVSVPLEALGEGQPKLLSWELKKAPFIGVGVLRFSGGTIEGRNGKEEIELSAIIDVDEARVLTVQLDRQGAKKANWTWEEGKLVVASADGVNEEVNLRVGRDPLVATQTQGPRRYATEREPSSSFWSPFEGPWGGGGAKGQNPQRYTSKKKKAKSLFDLLFN